MIDYRIQTFIILYETMNYRLTAEKLQMTQPAVTQHIHFLEKEYGCILFSYDRRTLHKTKEADLLYRYSISMQYNEQSLRKALEQKPGLNIRFGATKTIGEFVISDLLIQYLSDPNHNLALTVDNTAILLNMLDHHKIDFALIEGYFDKQIYGYQLFRKELFIGICAPNHPFAGKEVSLQNLFSENLILREYGSGTRAIFEDILHEYSFNINHFKKAIYINNFKIITELVAAGTGISFVYESIAKSSESVAIFTIKNEVISREFNYIYLKGTDALSKITAFESIS